MLLIFVVISLASILAFYVFSLRKKNKVKRWYKILQLKKHEACFKQIYCGVNGFTLSQTARQHQDAIEYLYGEIDFVSFIALLSLANPKKDTVFYDLGSGTGKAVLACAMVFDVQKSIGIELFTLLHKTAVKQCKRLQSLPEYARQAEKIFFINNNFLHEDFADATLIFINAVAFIGETWVMLNQRLARIACPTVITIGKKLLTDAFVMTKTTTVTMSWGLVTAYIQQRKNLLQLNPANHRIDNIE